MELKWDSQPDHRAWCRLLIVPYGIEITVNNSHNLGDPGLLIVPYGIEMLSKTGVILPHPPLLIVPYGIEM